MPASREEVQQKVIDTLATFGPEKEDIIPEATLESLDIDSLDLAELSQVMEEEYGVEVKSEDAAQVKTVNDAVELVVGKLS